MCSFSPALRARCWPYQAFRPIPHWQFCQAHTPIFFARFLHRLRLPMCLTLVFFVNNAPFIRSFSLGCFAILPNRRICIQGGALLAASPSRSRRASVADAISFVAVHSAVPNKAPLIDFLLLISNFRSSSSPRLFVSIITIFSHSNSGAFKLFTKVIERNNSWVGRNAVPSCFII